MVREIRVVVRRLDVSRAHLTPERRGVAAILERQDEELRRQRVRLPGEREPGWYAAIGALVAMLAAGAWVVALLAAF
jgi:hypothetical protein